MAHQDQLDPNAEYYQVSNFPKSIPLALSLTDFTFLRPLNTPANTMRGMAQSHANHSFEHSSRLVKL